MMPRNVRDAHRQSRGALPLLVRGRWLKHWVPNTAELAVARSCWHGCRDPSPVFITTVLNVVSLFFFFFPFYYGHIHCLGEDAWLWTNPAALFIYVGNYFLSGQQAVLSKTMLPSGTAHLPILSRCDVWVSSRPSLEHIMPCSQESAHSAFQQSGYLLNGSSC